MSKLRRHNRTRTDSKQALVLTLGTARRLKLLLLLRTLRHQPVQRAHGPLDELGRGVVALIQR